MSVDVPPLGKVPTPVGDEREAIMSLLGLHSGSATGNSTESHSSSREGDRAEESEQSEDDESETGVASPILRRHEDDSSSESEAEKSRPRTSGSGIPGFGDVDSARSNNMGMPLRRIGKKRKHHTSVDGQFEDAQESYLPSTSGPVMTPAHSHLHSHSSSYSDRSVPPPPHLIQQTSNEFGTHAQKSAELARQALAYQQRAMIAETSGLYPSPRIPTMMPSSNMADIYERRFHMEAMMAFQAKMHFARQAGPHSQGLPPPVTGIPGAPLTAAYGAAALPRRSGPPPPSRPDIHRGSETDDDDSAKIGFAMRPPLSPQANRVESEDEDDDPYKREAAPIHQNKKPRNTIPFSTKERYERYTPPPSWGKLIKVPKMPPVPGDEKIQNPITEIHENDVLLGRGGLTNTNPGNIKFRKLVSKYRVHYCTAPKGDKGALARYLCNYVRAMNGRFLAKAPDDPSWYEVGDEKAVSKCGQALREGTAEFNRKETESFGTNV